MLIEAYDRNSFFENNSSMEPIPTEIDRLKLIVWLQFLASFPGLLHSEEITQIRECDGKISADQLLLPRNEITSFDELRQQTLIWEGMGETIGLFHGSFDPPTVYHLSCATLASQHCDRLLIGFDNDELLRRRKGADRPRSMGLGLDRRKIFGSFWMVDGTFFLRANDVLDAEQYVIDYRDLGVNYVFLDEATEDLEKRMSLITQAGARPMFLSRREGDYSSTKLIELAKESGHIPK